MPRQLIGTIRTLRYIALSALAALVGSDARQMVAADVAEDPSAQQFVTSVRPFLEANCFACHGNGKHKGDVTLDAFKSFDAVKQDRQTWDDVTQMLRDRQMPPKKAPQPQPQDLQSLLKWNDAAMEMLDRNTPHDPGFVPIHRLNRREYDNTLRDLLGIDFQASDDFPADDTGYGFDNIADVLSMSSLLAEKYVAAAELAMAKALPLGDINQFKVVRIAGDTLKGAGRAESSGARGLLTNGGAFTRFLFPAAADYEFRIRASGDQAGNEPVRFTFNVDASALQTFDVTALPEKPQTITTRVHLTPGERDVTIAFINDYWNPSATQPTDSDRNLYIHSIEIRGPINPAPASPSQTQRRLLFCGPADGSEGEACAVKIIERFATSAYRRPATADDVERLMSLYRGARAAGDPFDKACRLAMTGALVSPQFLYRVEPDTAGHPEQVRALNDYEVASRLSYFLWSSMPDDALFAAAAAGKLHSQDDVRAQSHRMLADRRSSAFVKNFVGQWLELRNLDGASVDFKRFTGVDRKLLKSMRHEGEMYFANLIEHDLSILELINSNYTFVDDKLARLYGIPNVSGADFRRVQLEGEVAQRRGGVLSMAGVLTVSAMPSRTSPPKRGKFVLDQILGTPPPPPPPNVATLKDHGPGTATMSLRQQLERHRADATCASCHARIDPIGFAMENFDAVGSWRDRDGAFPVDSSDTLPTGEAISGIQGLKQMILDHKDQFTRALVEKMMTFALGRGTSPSDRPVISDICHKVRDQQYHISAVIDGIVTSDAFLKRHGKIPTTGPTTGANP